MSQNINCSDSERYWIDSVDMIDERLSKSKAILRSMLSSSSENLELEEADVKQLMWMVDEYLSEVRDIVGRSI